MDFNLKFSVESRSLPFPLTFIVNDLHIRLSDDDIPFIGSNYRTREIKDANGKVKDVFKTYAFVAFPGYNNIDNEQERALATEAHDKFVDDIIREGREFVIRARQKKNESQDAPPKAINTSRLTKGVKDLLDLAVSKEQKADSKMEHGEIPF